MQQQSIPHTWTSNQETQSLTADMCKVKQNKDAVGPCSQSADANSWQRTVLLSWRGYTEVYKAQ